MIRKHLHRHIKKHHYNLGGIALAVSVVVFSVSVLWDFGMIELPAKIVSWGRQLSGAVATSSNLSAELPLKFHKQEHSLSCEAAVLKMVLNYHGVDVSESEVIEKMPFDETPRSGNVWGDPDIGFVGNIDGKMMVDGYGIYWGPLAITASHWKDSKIIKHGLAKDLAGHISAGRPVIIWGYLGRGKPVGWQTSEGKKIYGINGEHAFVVYGYDGPVDNPVGFKVMDPLYGPKYWKTSELIRNWDSFGRMGMVVYP